MKTATAFLIGLALCTLSAAAFAQESGAATGGAPAAALRRPAELDQLKPLLPIGTAKCTGKTYASPLGAEHGTRLTMTIKPELDGFWYVARGQEEKTAENPTPGKFLETFGYDNGKKKFVAIGYDNIGGHFIETSDGPTDGKIVYTGTYTLNGNDFAVRDTMTATSHVGEMQTGSEWKKTDEESCTKK